MKPSDEELRVIYQKALDGWSFFDGSKEESEIEGGRTAFDACVALLAKHRPGDEELADKLVDEIGYEHMLPVDEARRAAMGIIALVRQHDGDVKTISEEIRDDPELRAQTEHEWFIDGAIMQIEQAMERVGITRKQLAERLKCSPPNVTQLLRHGSNLTLGTLMDIALALEHRFLSPVLQLLSAAAPWETCTTQAVTTNGESTGGEACPTSGPLISATPIAPVRTTSGTCEFAPRDQPQGLPQRPEPARCNDEDMWDELVFSDLADRDAVVEAMRTAFWSAEDAHTAYKVPAAPMSAALAVAEKRFAEVLADRDQRLAKLRAERDEARREAREQSRRADDITDLSNALQVNVEAQKILEARLDEAKQYHNKWSLDASKCLGDDVAKAAAQEARIEALEAQLAAAPKLPPTGERRVDPRRGPQTAAFACVHVDTEQGRSYELFEWDLLPLYVDPPVPVDPRVEAAAKKLGELRDTLLGRSPNFVEVARTVLAVADAAKGGAS